MSPHFIQVLNSQFHGQIISSKEESLKLIQHLVDFGAIVHVNQDTVIQTHKIFTVTDLNSLYNSIPSSELYIHLPNMEAFLLKKDPIAVDTTALAENLIIHEEIVQSLPRDLVLKKKTVAVEEPPPTASLPPFADDVPVPDPIDTVEPIIPTESPLTLDGFQPVAWYTTIWDHVDVIVKLITSWWC